MIDHIGISVSSIARATEFYLKALAPLGYGIVPRSRRGRRQRRAGTEAHYHANYYAAFVLDLNGNNIEALCHGPE
jgi:hypothetical protein